MAKIIGIDLGTTSAGFGCRERLCSSTPADPAYYLTSCANGYNGCNEGSLLVQSVNVCTGNLEFRRGINSWCSDRSSKFRSN